MKRLIFGLLVSVCAVSCQVTLGGGQITLSGNDFQVDKEGGEVSITTSCVGHCDISEKENPPYDFSASLDLYGSEPITFDGAWYSFRSEDNGTLLSLKIYENTSGQDRVLKLILFDADLSGKVVITQSGK